MNWGRKRHNCRPHEHYRRHYEEFQKYHKRVKFLRPVVLLFNLAIGYFLFRTLGLKTISIFFAVIISIKGIWEIFFLMRLEKRIFKPIEKLKNGVDEIAKGNYNVQIKHDETYVLNMLIDSFNDMAQKLHESEKVKAEYEESRKMLIANISHDLKTPVTSIQGYIEAILDGTVIPPEILNKYLQTIYSNSVYINKLIDDLFLFSKLDMQKLNFEYENLPVKAFMNDLMEEFKFELEEKDCNFDYIDKLENDCYVNIDRKRLNQAIRNIIGNALKYGTEKEMSIRVEMYRQDYFVCIGIWDNGPGIPEDKLPHIFERFYRIDYERTKDLMSTGLGLAIAKELIEAHGGRIKVASVENEGTCFTIMLPV
ncbi:MAG: HAMP domain-containing sensor histidine kinase [Eubacteriales bacterium]